MRNDYYYLEHSGRKGMKWGQRLYQNKDGSLTPLGRIHYAKKKREANAKRKASLEKARSEKAKKAAYEAKKQKVLKSGSAEDILKYKGDLTDQEMRDAITRLGLERQLNQLQPPKHPKAKAVFDVVVDKVILPAGKEVLSKQLNKGVDAGIKVVVGKFAKDKNNGSNDTQSDNQNTKQTKNEKAASRKAKKGKDWTEDIIDAEFTVKESDVSTGMLYLGTLLDK